MTNTKTTTPYKGKTYERGYELWDVRRHIIWNNLRPDLKEDLAHLVQDIRRRICSVASAGSPSFSV